MISILWLTINFFCSKMLKCCIKQHANVLNQGNEFMQIYRARIDTFLIHQSSMQYNYMSLTTMSRIFIPEFSDQHTCVSWLDFSKPFSFWCNKSWTAFASNYRNHKKIFYDKQTNASASIFKMLEQGWLARKDGRWGQQ